MKLDMKTPLKIGDSDGLKLTGDGGEVVGEIKTLGEMLRRIYGAPVMQGENFSGPQFYHLGVLDEQIEQALKENSENSEVDLAAEDIALAKERLPKLMPAPRVIKAVYDFLEQK